MAREQVLEKVTEILREEFEDDELEVTDATTAADVEEWDSLTYLSMIHEVEVAFKIRFFIGEIQEFKNVGEMIDSILKHLAK